MRNPILNLLTLIIFASAFSVSANAQMLNRKYTTKITEKYKGQKLSDDYKTNPLYAGETIKMLTPSFPVTFSRIERDTMSNWRIGPQAGIGASYFFLLGKGYRNPQDETIQVEPYFVVGISVDAGVSQNLQAQGVVQNINIGGVLGLYKYVNVIFSYDILNERPIYGLGTRIDLFAVTQGSGTIILNKDKFFK